MAPQKGLASSKNFKKASKKFPKMDITAWTIYLFAIDLHRWIFLWQQKHFQLVKSNLLGYDHTKQQQQRQWQWQQPMLVYSEAWKWVWYQFSSVTIDQHWPLTFGVVIALIVNAYKNNRPQLSSQRALC